MDLEKIKFPYTLTVIIFGASMAVLRLGLAHVTGENPLGTGRPFWVVWALAYRQYSTDYVANEANAKALKLGLWRGEFVPPWEWRKGER